VLMAALWLQMGKCNFVFIDFWMHMLLRKVSHILLVYQFLL